MSMGGLNVHQFALVSTAKVGYELLRELVNLLHRNISKNLVQWIIAKE